MTKYFLMLMQDEVKRVKLVGLMPSNFNADDGRSYPGFRFYCTEENENAYGITTRSLLFAEVVKAAIPFVTVFFFGGYIVRGFCSAAFTGRFKL